MVCVCQFPIFISCLHYKAGGWQSGWACSWCCIPAMQPMQPWFEEPRSPASIWFGKAEPPLSSLRRSNIAGVKLHKWMGSILPKLCLISYVHVVNLGVGRDIWRNWLTPRHCFVNLPGSTSYRFRWPNFPKTNSIGNHIGMQNSRPDRDMTSLWWRDG